MPSMSSFDNRLFTHHSRTCPLCDGLMTSELGNTRWVCSSCGARLSFGLTELITILNYRPPELLATTLEALQLQGFSIRHPAGHLEIALPQLNESWEFPDRTPATSEELRDMLYKLAQQQQAVPRPSGPVPPEERIYCPNCHSAASRREQTCQWCGTPLHEDLQQSD